jgi:N-acetylneuraminic acid mutarotase
VILFGGFTEPGDDAPSSRDMIITGDTWSYDYNTNTWEELEPNEAPPARGYSAIAYDAKSDRVILFGGEDESAGNIYKDTWVYQSDTNTWTELYPDISPSNRGWHAMVYSTKAQRIILFGGGVSREQCTDETWIYDSETNTWTNATSNP